MKVIWESADVKVGMRVRKPGCNEAWMVGYDPSIKCGNEKLAVISLIDGMISVKGLTAEGMAEHLNKSGVHPVTLVGEQKSSREQMSA